MIRVFAPLAGGPRDADDADAEEDLSKPMHVKPSATPSQARALLAALELPENVTLADGHEVPLRLLAQAIADDSHLGDDAVHPFHLRATSRLAVKLKRLAKLVRSAGGQLALTSQVAAQCCDIPGWEACVLGNMALADLEHAGKLGGYAPCINAMREDAAALVLVVGVLLYERAQPDPPSTRRARTRPMSAKALTREIQDTDNAFEQLKTLFGGGELVSSLPLEQHARAKRMLDDEHTPEDLVQFVHNLSPSDRALLQTRMAELGHGKDDE